MISAPGDPPGSRVSFVWMPNARNRSARIDAWVDFPVPSPPSKVMKRPCISQPLLAWLSKQNLIRNDRFVASVELGNELMGGSGTTWVQDFAVLVSPAG